MINFAPFFGHQLNQTIEQEDEFCIAVTCHEYEKFILSELFLSRAMLNIKEKCNYYKSLTRDSHKRKNGRGNSGKNGRRSRIVNRIGFIMKNFRLHRT